MEGNGPLHGTHRHLGKIVLADDPVAADFTCARLMGLDPYRVWHLAREAQFLGNGSYDRIDLIAEGLAAKDESLCCAAGIRRSSNAIVSTLKIREMWGQSLAPISHAHDIPYSSENIFQVDGIQLRDSA